MTLPTLVIVLLLAVVGAGAIVLVLGRVQVMRLGRGSRSVALSSPLDFASRTVAIPALVVGALCLLGAAYLVGLPARLLPERKVVVPLTPDELSLVDVTDDRVVIRTIQQDSMAGYSLADAVGDFEVSAEVKIPVGTGASVTCIAFRAAGTEIRPGQQARTADDHGWPDSGYMACLSVYGQWSLAKFEDGEATLLEDFKQWGNLRNPDPNEIAVKVEGAAITVTINGIEATSLTDDAFATGAVQLVCGTPPEATPAAVCHFTNVKLTRLD